MVALENDSYKMRQEKICFIFCQKELYDSSSNEKKKNSNNGISLQQIEPFSSPQTIEKVTKDENIELGNIPKSTPLLYHHDTSQPRNRTRSIENVHWNKSAHGLDEFLLEEIGLTRKELDNKQKIIHDLIHLLNDVTAKRGEKLRMKIN